MVWYVYNDAENVKNRVVLAWEGTSTEKNGKTKWELTQASQWHLATKWATLQHGWHKVKGDDSAQLCGETCQLFAAQKATDKEEAILGVLPVGTSWIQVKEPKTYYIHTNLWMWTTSPISKQLYSTKVCFYLVAHHQRAAVPRLLKNHWKSCIRPALPV